MSKTFTGAPLCYVSTLRPQVARYIGELRSICDQTINVSIYSWTPDSTVPRSQDFLDSHRHGLSRSGIASGIILGSDNHAIRPRSDSTHIVVLLWQHKVDFIALVEGNGVGIEELLHRNTTDGQGQSAFTAEFWHEFCCVSDGYLCFKYRSFRCIYWSHPVCVYTKH